MTDSDASEIPLVVLERVQEFDQALTKVEELIDKEIASCSHAEHLKREPVDRARVDLLWLYAANSLFATSLNVKGDSLKNHENLKKEMKRVQDNFARLKAIEDKANMPRMNKFAAKAFVRNALWEPDDKKNDSDVTEAKESIEDSCPQVTAAQSKSEAAEQDAPRKKKRRQR